MITKWKHFQSKKGEKMAAKLQVTIWNEFYHEKSNPKIAEIYPDGLHQAIADGIAAPDLEIRLASLDQPECGLTDEVLAKTDVLMWWGHCKHADVPDELVKKIQKKVLEGMGLIVMHSGHFSKIFKTLMGTNCSLKWREVGERERIWNIDPMHPITEGIGDYFELPHVEMYGERFDIPSDGHVVFISWYEGGEVFRSGVTFERGYGKIFYFSPGHETYPIYYDANIRRVLGNAVRWAKPLIKREHICPNVKPLEVIHSTDPAAGAKAGIVQKVN